MQNEQELKKFLTSEPNHKPIGEYKVDNAIVMAAGVSSRFAPISYDLPKGLIKVKGEILIERQIRQLKEAGINDIIIIVGFMKEKFFYLEDMFDVKIVVNEDYYKYNNCSSLIRVLDKLNNTYICSSDNYFTENVFEPYVYQAYYPICFRDKFDDEYSVQVDNDDYIKSISTEPNTNQWILCGHVYFDSTFSKKFKKILLENYSDKRVKDNVWEYLLLKNIDKLKIKANKYKSGVINEFDTVDDVVMFDSNFLLENNSQTIENISNYFKCSKNDIGNFRLLDTGLTNASHVFSVKGKGDYVYRQPGVGTQDYINRQSEAMSMILAQQLGLDNTYVFMDKSKGWKISKYIHDVKLLDYSNDNQISKALGIVKKLHKCGKLSKFDFGIWDQTLKYIQKIDDCGRNITQDFAFIFKKIESIYNEVSKDPFAKKCWCHIDCYSPNFLIDKKGNMSLIDWEYSGNDDPASDLGTFICCSNMTYEKAKSVIREYTENDNEDEIRHFIGYVAIASFFWYNWSLYQETRGNHMDSWMYLWYKNAKFFADKYLSTR